MSGSHFMLYVISIVKAYILSYHMYMYMIVWLNYEIIK